MGARNYKVTLITKGPVHIGSGTKLEKKDYFYDKGILAVLDMHKFVGLLDDAEVGAYIEFLERQKSNEGLEGFLSASLRDKARKSIAYELHAPRNVRRLEIATCVKGPDGKPYIPGSSLKGMVRTALLSELVSQDPGRYIKSFRDSLMHGSSQSDWKNDKRSAQPIEVEAFRNSGDERYDEVRGKMFNDAFRYLSVSDSDPLDVRDLVLAQKYDKFSKEDDGSHKCVVPRRRSDAQAYEGNELNIYRECIKPGTTVSFDLSIDGRIDECLSIGTVDAACIMRVLADFYERYRKRYLSKFDISASEEPGSTNASDGICRYIIKEGPLAGCRCRNHEVKGTGYCKTHQAYAAQKEERGPAESVCFLGGGVGYPSKTITNSLIPDESASVKFTSAILYSQFPSKLSDRAPEGLARQIKKAGYAPVFMEPRGRSKKVDHRHWKDDELGVSPHTLKMGEVESKKYLMGECSISLRELR